MSSTLLGDDKPAVAVSHLVHPFGIVNQRQIPVLRAGLSMAEVRPLPLRKSPGDSYVYDEESVAQLAEQLATLRDQLATVTLERDALRANVETKEELLRTAYSALRWTRTHYKLHSITVLDAMNAIDAALQEKKHEM